MLAWHLFDIEVSKRPAFIHFRISMSFNNNPFNDWLLAIRKIIAQKVIFNRDDINW